MNVYDSTSQSKGTSYYRGLCRQVQEIRESGNEWSLSMMQSFGLDDGNTDEIHPSVMAAAGMDCHLEVVAKNLNYKFSETQSGTKATNRCESNIPTVFQISSIKKNEIREKTGFRNCAVMPSFIIVICNGSVETMSETQTTLSWFEEWFLLRLYSKGFIRWCNYAREHQKSEKQLRNIFASKLRILYNCRNTWPKFASYDEDIALQGSRWDEYYQGK
jgi:hypothetical protein